MIREFRQSDMDSVLEIWLEASIQAHDFIEREFWESKVDAMKTLYIPSCQTYVFEEAGVVKGFLSVVDETLAALFVSPGSQGNGIGRQLIAKAKTLQNHWRLTVYTENKKSVQFYQKQGFDIIKEQTDRHTGHSEWVMEFYSKNTP